MPLTLHPDTTRLIEERLSLGDYANADNLFHALEIGGGPARSRVPYRIGQGGHGGTEEHRERL